VSHHHHHHHKNENTITYNYEEAMCTQRQILQNKLFSNDRAMKNHLSKVARKAKMAERSAASHLSDA
jgi:hypothetical protein